MMINERDKQFLRILAGITAVKLLLIPSYKSTDFEVHRNWLAITSSLPLNQWYVENRSPWTLDYPPLFAWFEFLLAQIAKLFDPEMLRVENLNYSSPETILFQRLSVCLSDLVLISSVWFAAQKSKISLKRQMVFYGLVVLNAGLLIVDHIHFQYNGFLIGLLLWSALCIEQDKCLLAAILFASLLNLKHLFVYSAPVYFTYLLSHYCLRSKSRNPIISFCKLGVCVMSVCLCSFGPFIWYGQLTKVIQRLFPFGRGLCHVYWAPNAWALYSFLDKILSICLDKNLNSSTTSGLVGEGKYSVLVEVTPTISFLLVFAFVSIPAVLMLLRPFSAYFMECVAYANLCGFIWGYHVHEKAIIPVLISLIFVGFRGHEEMVMNHRDHFLFLSTVAHYSLTSLLYGLQEYPIKIFLVLWYALLVKAVGNEPTTAKLNEVKVFQRIEQIGKRSLLLSLCILESGQLGFGILGIKTHYEFLPLMLTSVLCATGIFYYWIKWTCAFFQVLVSKEESQKKSQ